MSFCAVCTRDKGPFVQRVLDDGGPLVTICEPCDQEHPRTGRYAFGGGEAVSRTLAPGARRGARGTGS